MTTFNESKMTSDQCLSLDISQAFVDVIKKGNRLLESGRVHEASIAFLMVEKEMEDFIEKQFNLLAK